ADMRAEGFGPEAVHFAEETEIVDDTGRVREVDGRVERTPDGERPRVVRLIASTRGRRARVPSAGDAPPEPVAHREVRWPDGARPPPGSAGTALDAGSTIRGPGVLRP